MQLKTKSTKTQKQLVPLTDSTPKRPDPEVPEKRPRRRFVLSDEIIRLTGLRAEEKCPHPLRRIVVWDRDNDREIVLLTNHLEIGASTIAEIY